MQTQWRIEVLSDGSNAVFVATYKNGRFAKLEHKSGKLANQKQHASLMYLVPELEKAIEFLRLEYKDKPVTWSMVEKTEKDALIKRLLATYNEWYHNRNDIMPVINGIQVNALKSIANSLIRMSSSEDEVVSVWQQLLSNWNSLSSFYQSQMELRQINSNINIILRTLKNENKEQNNFRQQF